MSPVYIFELGVDDMSGKELWFIPLSSGPSIVGFNRSEPASKNSSGDNSSGAMALLGICFVMLSVELLCALEFLEVWVKGRAFTLISETTGSSSSSST